MDNSTIIKFDIDENEISIFNESRKLPYIVNIANNYILTMQFLTVIIFDFLDLKNYNF